MFTDEQEDILIKLGVSLLIGLLIGGEREYRNKSAGLRTIILICLGSTIFTILSLEESHSTEVGRIASNIVTGIGFLGAGAIMRDGLNVSGLTTASTIWVAAALGMAVGFGEYELAINATIIVLIVLVLFSYFQRFLDQVHKTVTLHVIFHANDDAIKKVEQTMRNLKLSYTRNRECRNEGDVKYEYELSGRGRRVDDLISYLISLKEQVKAFEYW